MRPQFGNSSEAWICHKMEENIIPENVRTRDLELFPHKYVDISAHDTSQYFIINNDKVFQGGKETRSGIGNHSGKGRGSGVCSNNP